MAYIVASFKLTFLWQVTSRSYVMTFEPAKIFGSLASFLTVLNCCDLLSIMCILTVWAFCMFLGYQFEGYYVWQLR